LDALGITAKPADSCFPDDRITGFAGFQFILISLLNRF